MLFSLIVVIGIKTVFYIINFCHRIWLDLRTAITAPRIRCAISTALHDLRQTQALYSLD